MRTLAMFVALTALTAAAAGVQPADLYRIRSLAEPQISPDGKMVVYTVRQANEKTNTTDSDLWRIVLPDGVPQQLTFSGRASAAQWSPDGKTLAFLSSILGIAKQVYALPMQGGEPHPVTSLGGGVSSFSWSPDSSKLACASATGKGREAGETLYFRSPAYKFDGVGFYDDRRSQIWVVEVASGKSVQLTSGNGANHIAPQWSPDGKRIAFVRARTDMVGSQEQSLFVISPEGGEPEAAGGPRIGTNSPRWSPDGRRIAFTGSEDSVAIPMLWVWEIGKAPAVLNRDVTYPDALAWSGDGKSILYSANYRGSHPVFQIDAVSGASRPVPDARQAADWAWHSRTQSLIRVGNDTTHPDELFAGARQLTSHNREYVAATRMSAMERFTYKGDDGWDIDAFFVPPLARDPAQKAPLIVTVHGGPNGMYGEEWLQSVQVLAANGWAVLMTNPRGSSGYGAAFQRGVDKEWGGKAYRDVQAGVDAALARYSWLDAERLAITGWSFGGFMTDWTVTQTRRFRAAASISGITNFLSVEGTRDGHYGHTRDFGGDLWQAHDLYWKYSPIRLASVVKTPLLVLHGGADNRVPVEQSEQWFRALQRFGVPSEFVIFPGEPHVIRREPRHEIEVNRWLVYWFQRYLASNERAIRPNAQ